MSAEATLVFFGARFEIAEEEIASLENRSHPLVVVARQNGLNVYWGNVASEGNKYRLFILLSAHLVREIG